MGIDHTSIQLLRHATLILTFNNKKILIDPMLTPTGKLPPIPLTTNRKRNPLVSLPIDTYILQQDFDAIIVTHRHFDHFDDSAKKMLSKSIPLFCQPKDEKNIKFAGFKNVISVTNTFTWDDIRITRVGGKHGTGIVGKIMGSVSGFVLQFDRQSIYIAGDTIYNSDVKNTLEQYRPQITVVNSGSAQMLVGSPITMTAEDVVEVAKSAPYTKVIAVHMEAINHCKLTRNNLYTCLDKEKLLHQVLIPQNGETLYFS